jgi:N-acetylneuraminic acid mutarotase
MGKTFIAFIITGLLFITIPAPAITAGWEEMTGTLPTARYGHSMVEIDGALYVFGGVLQGSGSARMGDPDPPNPAPVNDLWRFNKDHAWQQLTPLNAPPARQGHAATADNGKMYIHGGKDAGGASMYDLWVYEPSANLWTESASGGTTPSPRYNHTITALPDGSQGGRIVIFGGMYNATTPSSTNPYAYCPTTGVWYRKNAPSFASLVGHTAVAKDNTMVAVGGSANGKATSNIWQFDLNANRWTQITPTGPSPDPRLFHSIANTNDGFRIFGGDTDASSGMVGKTANRNDAWEFNFTTREWTQLPAMPIPISQGAASEVTIDGVEKDVLFGGLTGSSYVTTAYAYTPDTGDPRLTVTLTGTGTVTSSPSGIICGATCTGTFASGTPITLTATPGTGFVLGYWSGACEGTTCGFTITRDTTVRAAFVPASTRKVPLAVSRVKTNGGDGTITSKDEVIACGTACRNTYYKNAMVTLTAAPGAGSVFTGWRPASLGCTGSTCTFTMTGARTVQGVFVGPQRLTVVKQKVRKGNGTVTSNPAGIDCGLTCTRTSSAYSLHQPVILTAAPGAGSVFTGWRPASLGCTGSTCTVAMEKALTVTAVFTGTKAEGHEGEE